MEIIGGRLSYPGPPVYAPDGAQDATYSPPGRVVIVSTDNDDDGVGDGARMRDIGGFTYDELGLTITNGVARPIVIKPLGYLIPPRTDTGGKSGDPLTRRWLIAHKPEQFTALCEQLSRASRDKGWNFTPAEVKKSLQDMEVGNGDRIYLGTFAGDSSKRKRERCVYIDAEFALKSSED
jgi:hypothetical protein